MLALIGGGGEGATTAADDDDDEDRWIEAKFQKPAGLTKAKARSMVDLGPPLSGPVLVGGILDVVRPGDGAARLAPGARDWTLELRHVSAVLSGAVQCAAIG